CCGHMSLPVPRDWQGGTMPFGRKRRRGQLACLLGGALLIVAGSIKAQERRPSERDPAAQVSTQAMDLSMAWRLALENDHYYRAAISEQAAAQTERAQGRAELLPQIHAGYYRSKVKGDSIQYDRGGGLGSELNYDSYNAYVQLQQPVLNTANYARYRRGYARADMGNAVFRAKYEDAGIRLAQAYFNALLAYDRYVLQHGLTTALRSRSNAVASLYQRQEATRIDVQETQSRLVVAQAELIDAGNEWTLALRELESLLGVSLNRLTLLRDDP